MNDYHSLPSITAASFDERICLASTQHLMLLMVTADWCMPCRLFASSLQQIQRDNVQRVRCCKMDMAESALLNELADIQSLPTLCYFAHGKIVERSLGLLPLSNLQQRIDRIFLTHF